MAFLTFTEAKVVTPLILPRKYWVHIVRIIKGHLRLGINKLSNNAIPTRVINQ